MTPISEKESKELEAQAASNNDAPIPSATRDGEVAIGKEKSADQENQAARRDFLAGIRKLIKSFKSLSHIFEMYKDGDGDEEMDMNIEIGFPTDVQHVAHIGLDGSSDISSLKGLEGRGSCSLSNLTIEQFEFAMASLAAHKEHNVPVLDKRYP